MRNETMQLNEGYLESLIHFIAKYLKLNKNIGFQRSVPKQEMITIINKIEVM